MQLYSGLDSGTGNACIAFSGPPTVLYLSVIQYFTTTQDEQEECIEIAAHSTVDTQLCLRGIIPCISFADIAYRT